MLIVGCIMTIYELQNNKLTFSQLLLKFLAKIHQQSNRASSMQKLSALAWALPKGKLYPLKINTIRK